MMDEVYNKIAIEGDESRHVREGQNGSEIDYESSSYISNGLDSPLSRSISNSSGTADDVIYKLYCDARNNIEEAHSKLMELAKIGGNMLAELFLIPLYCRGNKFVQVSLLHARSIALKYSSILEDNNLSSDEYLCFIKGVYYDEIKCNYTESFKWYQKCADLGNSTGINNLGYCYFVGKGVKRSFKEAVKLYQAAAEMGNILAQANLGYCYYSGKGIIENFESAVFWFTKAADGGNAFGQDRLGYCYYKGEGVEKDYNEAVRLFSLSASQGMAEAQYLLGDCYYFGRGVARDYAESVKYYRLAVENGHLEAMNELGNLYYKGEGVSRDRIEAIKLWRISASQESPWAIKRLKLSNPQFRALLDDLKDISSSLKVEKALTTTIPDYLYESPAFLRTLSMPTEVLKYQFQLANLIYCLDADIALIAIAPLIISYL